MHPDGLYDLLLSAAATAQFEALANEGKATLRGLPDPERRGRCIQALQQLLPEFLERALESLDPETRARAEIQLMNQMLSVVKGTIGTPDPYWSDQPQVLQSLHRQHPPFEAPDLPLSVPWLFAAGQGDPSLLSELRRELASADRVDILVSFITWSGVRKLLDVLNKLTAVGANGEPRTRLRVLTTTYIGATELKAVVALAKLPGVDVRISLDGRRTRLHAKAWILHRNSGFGTALVGSANLTGAALLGGLEWTVRFTQAGQGELFASAKAHFETLWNDSEFQPFDPENRQHLKDLGDALTEEGRRTAPMATRTWFELQPKAYQQTMLDTLAAERRHQRTRNLLVAATGTGKTVIAAFDYRRISQETGGYPRLFFVAHRKEILLQARETYRQVLRNSDFGELLADGQVPEDYDHVFGTIQSIGTQRLLERLGPDHWHVVVIDECHHITADSFDGFARAVQPSILLGLTATPERADGVSIAPYFHMRADGSPAVELRLWEALDQQLLAPFEYYGVVDETDFSTVPWNQAGEVAELGRIINGDHIRARRIIDAFEKYTAAPEEARTLGFCVSVTHAEFMASQFNNAGIKAIAVTGGTSRDLRERIPRMLANREVNIVFTCDLYNEGVDLPDVDTLLLLRPTQSPVLFQQQIGRGLRLAHEKTSCLVLDFIGRHRVEFRFDRPLQALTGMTRGGLIQEVEAGFPNLPPGCLIQFEKVARDRVLENLRRALSQNWRSLARDLVAYMATRKDRTPDLRSFLLEQRVSLGELYRHQDPSGWTGLCRAAGLDLGEGGPQEGWLGRRYTDLLHANDPDYLQLWKKVAEMGCEYRALDPLDQRRVQMLAYQIYPSQQDAFDGPEFISRLRAHPHMGKELGELAVLLDEATILEPRSLPGAPEAWPLRLHAHYEAREILAAVGWLRNDRRAPFQSGVLRLHDESIELLFVTLDKREGYHAGIAYHDYAISPELFHWQTQNSAGPDTDAGRRYIESGHNGWNFQLFVRERKGLPYRALGRVRKAAIEGDRPMSITWKLDAPLPVDMMRAFSVLRGA